MFRMEIRFDENRINTGGKYSVDEIQDRLRRTMASVSIEQKEPGFFYGKGDKEDFSRFGGAIIMLKRQMWFMPFVDTWLWYTDTGVEDVAAHYHQRVTSA